MTPKDALEQPARQPRQALENDGYVIAPSVMGSDETAIVERALGSVPIVGAGTRNLLEAQWCRGLVRRLRNLPPIRDLLPSSSVAIQCTLFDKTPERNWLVAYHQDLSVPVKSRVAHPKLRCWSKKEGQHFIQPPEELLTELVAVRLHVDDCGLENGPLRVVPRSHLRGRIPEAELRGVRDELGEVVCPVERGGALLFKPLLLHASSKATSPLRRRVLHILFGPSEAGYGLRWPHAV